MSQVTKFNFKGSRPLNERELQNVTVVDASTPRRSFFTIITIEHHQNDSYEDVRQWALDEARERMEDGVELELIEQTA